MKKYNPLAVFVVLYVVFVIFLVLIHPFVASAAEKVPGGLGNTVVVNSIKSSEKNYGDRQQYHMTIKASDNSEIIGYIYKSSVSSYYTLSLYTQTSHLNKCLCTLKIQ